MEKLSLLLVVAAAFVMTSLMTSQPTSADQSVSSSSSAEEGEESPSYVHWGDFGGPSPLGGGHEGFPDEGGR